MAFVFGLFAILATANDICNPILYLWNVELGLGNILISIVFWFVFLAGVYSYANFCIYSSWASNLRHRREIKVEVLTGTPTMKVFERIKKWLRHRPNTLVFGIIYYVIAFISSGLAIGISAIIVGIAIAVVSAAILLYAYKHPAD